MRQSRFLLQLKKSAVFCLAALLIPYVITLAWTGRAWGSVEKAEKTGRYVILDRGSAHIPMELEEYMLGVLAVQISPETEMEALKAQAILARTAVRRQMDGKDEVAESALDMDYLGQGQMKERWGTTLYPEYEKRLRKAISETTGEVVCWNGDYIEPLFHQLSAGKTRQGSEDTPYLISVEEPEAVQGENYLSVFLFSGEELAKRLNTMTESPEVTADRMPEEIQIVEKDSAGYVESVLVGQKTYSGDAVRWALSLPSTAFHFEQAEQEVRCTVKGIGHGYGLDQYVANERAKKGWTAEQILNFYYKNIVIVTE